MEFEVMCSQRMTSISHELHHSISALLKETLQDEVLLKDFTPINGGCISNGGKLHTSKGIFFLKWNHASKFPFMFEAEAKGLSLLYDSNSIRIPTVVGVGETKAYQFILMEFIERHSKASDYWESLGTSLSLLHKKNSAAYGLDHDNYIGSLPQYNTIKKSWIEFFTTHRLQVQLKIAIDSKTISLSHLNKFETLFKKLPSILIEEKPCLVHGDLWSGNLITDEAGSPCLIDPAVYYGNREVDLAMTQLFGGFTDSFYQSYINAFPVEQGLQDRLDIYNLYPLLVHVNLFGQSYLSQVLSTLTKYTG